MATTSNSKDNRTSRNSAHLDAIVVQHPAVCDRPEWQRGRMLRCGGVRVVERSAVHMRAQLRRQTF